MLQSNACVSDVAGGDLLWRDLRRDKMPTDGSERKLDRMWSQLEAAAAWMTLRTLENKIHLPVSLIVRPRSQRCGEPIATSF